MGLRKHHQSLPYSTGNRYMPNYCSYGSTNYQPALFFRHFRCASCTTPTQPSRCDNLIRAYLTNTCHPIAQVYHTWPASTLTLTLWLLLLFEDQKDFDDLSSLHKGAAAYGLRLPHRVVLEFSQVYPHSQVTTILGCLLVNVWTGTCADSAVSTIILKAVLFAD